MSIGCNRMRFACNWMRFGVTSLRPACNRMRGGCDGEFAEHSPDQFPGPGYVLFFFPVLQVGHDGFHMGADLFGGPLLVCHVGDAEVDQLRRAGVTEFAAVVAPLAVVLVERAVRLLAGGGVLQRHAAALADQLPGRAQERIDRDVKS